MKYFNIDKLVFISRSDANNLLETGSKRILNFVGSTENLTKYSNDRSLMNILFNDLLNKYFFIPTHGMISKKYAANRLESGYKRIGHVIGTCDQLNEYITNTLHVQNLQYKYMIWGQHGLPEISDDYIKFYSGGSAPYHKLSNFYKTDVIYDGLTYPSSEHAFQAQKFIESDRPRFAYGGDLSTWSAFRDYTKIFFRVKKDQISSDVAEAKISWWSKKDNIGIIPKMATDKVRATKLGLTFNDYIKNEQNTKDLFIDILYNKYSKNLYLKKLLLSTDNIYLLEFSRSAKRNCPFWAGIIEKNDEEYVIFGNNAMGKYIMEVRELLR
jgi:predicted NAD-dependent protein-ADP-ribosyltransferase YbiA (DUF1768 family)